MLAPGQSAETMVALFSAAPAQDLHDLQSTDGLIGQTMGPNGQRYCL